MKMTSSNNNNLIEFYNRVKNDGIITIDNDQIVKNKPISHLTVDLQYDAKAKVFLDSDKNIYIFEEITINEIYNL